MWKIIVIQKMSKFASTTTAPPLPMAMDQQAKETKVLLTDVMTKQ